MAKFKVGDIVRVTADGLRFPQGTKGVLTKSPEESGFPFRLQSNNPSKGWMAVREDEIERVEVTPPAPKPKTIPARNLSGKHIGRVVTITTKSGAVISDELEMVGHGGDDAVTVVLKNVSQASRLDGYVRQEGFSLDPESEVVVNA